MIDKETTCARRKEPEEAVNEGISDQKLLKQLIQESMENGKANIHVNIDDLYKPLRSEMPVR